MLALQSGAGRKVRFFKVGASRMRLDAFKFVVRC